MLIGCASVRRWFPRILWWAAAELRGYASVLVFVLVKKLAVAVLTCVFALGGASIGSISGAIKGQTTETGFLRGVGVGAVTGAFTGVQLLELMLNGEPFSKVAFICSLANGKIFMEWVSPAVLKAYQWQISTMDTGLREISDIFEDLKDGEYARFLPSCRHFFHPHCIDEWLTRQGSCPTCRTDV